MIDTLLTTLTTFAVAVLVGAGLTVGAWITLIVIDAATTRKDPRP